MLKRITFDVSIGVIVLILLVMLYQMMLRQNLSSLQIIVSGAIFLNFVVLRKLTIKCVRQ